MTLKTDAPFLIGVIGLEHGHIYAMCEGLEQAGARIVKVFDQDPEKVKAFTAKFKHAKAVTSEEEIYQDGSIRMVSSAAIPSERAGVGLTAMANEKHFFSAKAPFTTRAQLEEAKKKTAATNLIWAVFYSERLLEESAIYASSLIEKGEIGEVVQVMGTGPHRVNAPTRPDWFFKKEQYGGILCDIGSHQIEQFLHFTDSTAAEVLHSKVGNYAHPDFPELEDFGDATLVSEKGATHYFRVDWLTPDGLSTWGDARTIILGTSGYIELRKNVDVARNEAGDHLYLVNQSGEHYINAEGKTGYPYFSALLYDCEYGTETAMSQEHAFKAAELSLIAQEQAKELKANVRG
ncbi:Gfo/Idh/MocA family protein [Salsuginibacillus kocurii]|uniref:Gfo/Idh/MocA family protein n=1 Tax=Salsuginibacillus kocurii TaxID=427078 RepID=UPI00037AC922|nr:Gfo/Idh/MocA family oxidoreductase [Salsuginibacillus kocurii]